MKRQTWKSGDVFLVPNCDGKFSVGQVIALETRTLRSASCAFFDQRVATVEEGRTVRPDLARCFSTLLVTPDGLSSGVWPVVGHAPLEIPPKLYPCEELLAKRKPGARVHGTGIVNEFLDAFHALRPWDDWARPDYLDALLLSRDKKPPNLIYSKK